MAIITYPLNGIDYDAENAETYLCTRTSGVYSADGNFQASVTGDRQVSISAGLAWIQNTKFAGKSVCNTESVAVEIPLADGTRPRIDRIVLRFDKAANASSIVLKQGTPSSAPAAPTVERTELVYELGLCTVQVPAASTIVSAGNVTSTLLDESVCGLMRDGVTGIPTEQLQEQVTALLADLRVAFENQLDLQERDFDAWFETIKGKLGDDPATALQSQVDDLQAAVGGMPLELSAGTNSVQVVADESRVGNVEVKGFTTQTGSGDASPANIRKIENAGMYNAVVIVDLNKYPYSVTTSGFLNVVRVDVQNALQNMLFVEGSTVVFARSTWLPASKTISDNGDYPHFRTGSAAGSANGLVLYIPRSVLAGTTATDIKNYFAQNPLSVMYQSTDDTGKFYTGIEVEQGDNYHCYIVELQASLHKGDTLETNVLYNGELKRVETHVKATVTVDGQTTLFTQGTNGYTVALPGAADGAVICNAFSGLSASIQSVTIPTSAFPSTVTNLETANTWAQSQNVVIEYSLSAPKVYADEPVKIKNPRGAFTVSSEEGATVSVSLDELVSDGVLKSANTYSTDEVYTGKTWIDGKPIYRKSYAVAAFPNKESVNVPLNISNIGQVVDYYGIASNGITTLRVPYYSVDGDGYGIQISITNNNTISIKTSESGNRSDYSGVITVEYTKL